MSNTINKTFIARLDALTLFLYFALVVIGLLAVFSVEYRSEDATFFLMHKSHMKQAMFLGISLFVGIIILFTDSKFFSSVAFLSYTIGIALLIITIFIGKNVKGSHSWLALGSFTFQPGEVCKIFTSLALAKFLSMPETNFKTLKHRIVGMAIALIPCFIIILQNETGLALVYFCFILVMYREGLPNAILIFGFSMVALALATLLVERNTLFIILTVMAIAVILLFRKRFFRDGMMRLVLILAWGFAILFSQVVIPFTFKNVMQGYQIERIYSMLGTEVPAEYSGEVAEPDGEAPKKKDNDYNVTQSKIAIGSGGLLGKGWLNGTSVGSSRVDLQACKLEYSIVSPK